MVLRKTIKELIIKIHSGILRTLYTKALCHYVIFSRNSYDSEGRLMNVTFPTGMVNNLYTDIYSALTVDIESSLTEEEISITTNTSTNRVFYTLAQGKGAGFIFGSGSLCVSWHLSLFQGSAGQC